MGRLGTFAANSSEVRQAPRADPDTKKSSPVRSAGAGPIYGDNITEIATVEYLGPTRH